MGILVIEYDVHDDGGIEVIALISAEEENDEDPEALEWLAWRNSFDDGGFGYVVMPEEAILAADATDDEKEILSIIERVIVESHNAKVREA